MSKDQAKGLRPEIQALRALAVTAVVVYHLSPAALSGGFVGVDVFFVISGFLISSHLFAQALEGRVRLLNFWAKRAKRLLPASALVLIAVVTAIATVVPLELRSQFFGESVAGALQFENWKLAHDAIDYFANTTPSPTQHFWSLSVEEQFYVALPLLLILVGLIARFTRLPKRVLIGSLIAVVSVASLAYSIHETAAAQGVAYVSTFARAWEFGIGAGLALMAPRVRTGAIGQLAATLGIAGIVIACVSYTDGSAFPGYIAALPVLATALAIWAGPTWLTAVGRWAPVALLGRISYSVYLWHFPLIALLPYITHHDLNNLDRIAIAIATVALAWASTDLVEDPIRYRKNLLGGRHPAIVLATTGLVTAALVGTSSMLASAAQNDIAHQHTADQAFAASHPRCFGAASMDPQLAPCINPALNGRVIPAPAASASDDADRRACIGMLADGTLQTCHLGAAHGTHRILAIGDSHMLSLIGALDQIGHERDWSIDLSALGGCYLTTATVHRPSTSLEAGCATWRTYVAHEATTGNYDGFFVTHWSQDQISMPGLDNRTAVVNGLVAAWRALPAKPIVALVDNPVARGDTLTCVGSAGAAGATSCAVPRSFALADFDGQRQAAARVSNARVIDLTEFYCTPQVCPPVIGGVLVQRDRSHITATFATTLAPYLSSRMAAAFGF